MTLNDDDQMPPLLFSDAQRARILEMQKEIAIGRWGPNFWNFLADVVFHPECDVVAYRDLLVTIVHVLPCHTCRYHAVDFLRDRPLKENCTQAEAQQHHVDFHNHVNMLHEKEVFSFKEAVATNSQRNERDRIESLVATLRVLAFLFTPESLPKLSLCVEAVSRCCIERSGQAADACQRMFATQVNLDERAPFSHWAHEQGNIILNSSEPWLELVARSVGPGMYASLGVNQAQEAWLIRRQVTQVEERKAIHSSATEASSIPPPPPATRKEKARPLPVPQKASIWTRRSVVILLVVLVVTATLIGVYILIRTRQPRSVLAAFLGTLPSATEAVHVAPHS
jgi:hypothetical protein